MKITAEQALKSGQTFYAKKWQQNGFYPIEKYVYHPESDAYEQFVMKLSGWMSWGIPYEKPIKIALPNGDITMTNYRWLKYIFENSGYILSFDEMKDDHNYNEF
jgi:hypothetical protein